MIYQLVDHLAQSADRPAFVPVPGRANIHIPSAERGTLGVRLRGELTEPIIASMEAGGPAAKAGLEIGDRIVAIEKQAINNVPHLLESMRLYSPKQEVTVAIMRGEKKIEIPVILGHY